MQARRQTQHIDAHCGGQLRRIVSQRRARALADNSFSSLGGPKKEGHESMAATNSQRSGGANKHTEEAGGTGWGRGGGSGGKKGGGDGEKNRLAVGAQAEAEWRGGEATLRMLPLFESLGGKCFLPLVVLEQVGAAGAGGGGGGAGGVVQRLSTPSVEWDRRAVEHGMGHTFLDYACADLWQ